MEERIMFMGIGFMKHSRVPYVMVSVSAQTGGSALGGVNI